MNRCKVMVGKYHPEMCGDRAPFTREVHDLKRDSYRMIPICSEHAFEAIEEEAEVWGPMGHPCRVDRDGEIFEEQPWA